MHKEAKNLEEKLGKQGYRIVDTKHYFKSKTVHYEREYTSDMTSPKIEMDKKSEMVILTWPKGLQI